MLRGEQSRGRAPVGASLRLLRGPAGHVPCGARPSVAPQNSLRSLRSLRSNSCGESVHEARCARRPKGSAPRRRRGAPPGTHPRLCDRRRCFAKRRRDAGIEPASRRTREQSRGRARRRLDACASPSLPQQRAVPAKTRAGGGRSASAAPTSAGLAGSARSAPRGLTRHSCPSVESEANAASSATARKTEQRRGRGPQGHAKAAVKRSTPPARGFARLSAAHAESNVLIGSRADRHDSRLRQCCGPG